MTTHAKPSQSTGPRRNRRMVAIYIALGIGAAVTLLVGLIAVLYVEDWSRDLTTNHAETTASHANSDQRPLLLGVDRPAATQQVLDAIHGLPNWQVESTTNEAARTIVHATRTTRLFRFVDDIRIYLNDTEDGTLLTATSHSRVGKGDFGQNPRNLRELIRSVRKKADIKAES